MARKINLKALYNTGELDIQLAAFTVEDTGGGSDGVASIIDGDSSTTLSLQLDDNAILSYNYVALVFSNPIQGRKFRFKTKTLSSDTLYIVAGDSNTPSTLTGFYTSPFKTIDPNTPAIETIFDFDTNNNAITTLMLGIADTPGGGDSYVYEVELYILEEADPYEFNDSVLTTKAWNSSRYDGRQLEGAVVNEFRSGDTTYGKTPVLQNYTRNIYIGNRLIGSENGGDDNDILAIPGYSYISTNRYLTINDDLSITDVRLDNFKEGSWTTLRGFYQSFNDDLKHKTLCQIIPFDDSIKASLKQEYKIYSNLGLFKKIVKFGPKPGLTLGIDTALNQTSSYLISTQKPSGDNTDITFGYWPSEGDDIPGGTSAGTPETRYNSGMVPTIYNREELLKFYTGSFYGSSYTIDFGDGYEDPVSYIGGTSDFVSNSSLGLFLDDLAKYAVDTLDSDDPNAFRDKENRRFFVSFCESGSDTPIILGRQGTISSSLEGSFTPNTDITDFSTAQVVGVSTSLIGDQGLQPAQQLNTGSVSNPDYGQQGYGLPKLRIKNQLIQHYNSNKYPTDTDFVSGYISEQPTLGYAQSPEVFATGSIIITRCDITQPSILINLKKNEELPNDIGNKPFIIVPHNLHPFIKENLIYFLIKAGLDIGDRKLLPGLNQSKRYPDRIGWKPPKPAPTIVLEEEREAKTRVIPEQRRLLARQLAEQNRRRRLEKLREEEENQRRKKRQSKREDRQEERKEKKKRREERKENRSENRQERREDRRENRRNRRRNR